MTISRPDSRALDALRPLKIEVNPLPHAEGSCIFHLGKTQVLISATLEHSLPPFLRGSNRGWLTAEYAMLPRATRARSDRRSQLESGRSKEIQRLIGRSLRSVMDLQAFAGKQIKLDCDVISADGGTRVAALSGAYVALAIALRRLCHYKVIDTNPLRRQVAALSCGVWRDMVVCDLCYEEDSTSEVDAHFVFSGDGDIVELQASGEQVPFGEGKFLQMLALARRNIAVVFEAQTRALAEFEACLR